MVKETNTALLGSNLSRKFFIFTLMSILFVEALIAVPYYFLKKEETLNTINVTAFREFNTFPPLGEDFSLPEGSVITGFKVIDEGGNTLTEIGQQPASLSVSNTENSVIIQSNSIEVLWQTEHLDKPVIVLAVLNNTEFVNKTNAILKNLLSLSASMLIIATLIITLLSHKYLVHPILMVKKSLLNARDDLESQDPQNIPHHEGNEIRQIANDIDHLLHTLSEGSQTIQDNERQRKGLDEQFKAIFNSSFLPIVLLDFKNFKILEANKATCDLLGFENSESANFSQDNFTPKTLKGIREFIENVLEQGSTMNSELVLQQIGGDEIPIEGYGSILKLADTPCILMIARDKRPWIKAEEELNFARKKAEYASQTKTNFLANMSHELRTPLTSINGFSKMIIDEAFGPMENEKYKEYIENILESGTHLLDIINDILDISRIEAGEMQLREQSVNFYDVANTCTKLVQNRAQKKNLNVTSELAENLPMVWADQRLLKQITLNLLSNSLKFTKKGTVTLGAEMTPDDRFRFYVRDTGIGISVENIEKALQPFGQIDTGLAKHIDGSGLGLPLSQALTNLHGGVLEINSKEGEGTTVYVTLPASRIEWVD